MLAAWFNRTFVAPAVANNLDGWGVLARLRSLESEKYELQKLVSAQRKTILDLEYRVNTLEKK